MRRTSYGFRAGRQAHEALDALAVGLRMKKVNWVLDADIRGYFDSINHEWLVKFIEGRIWDGRMAEGRSHRGRQAYNNG